MKKIVSTKEFGNIVFCIYHDCNSDTEFDDQNKPKDGYTTYLSLFWVDKYGDKIGFGGMELNIPINSDRLRNIGSWLLAQVEKI